MKTEFNRSQKILAIRQVLEDHTEVFEGKSEALLVSNSFLEQSQQLLNKINLLVVPASTSWVERTANRQLFDDLLYKMVNIGVLLARRKGDLAMQNSFNEFSRSIQRISASRAIAIAEVVVSTFAANEEMLPPLGVDPEARSQFEQLLSDYRQSSRQAIQGRAIRKQLKTEIDVLIKSLNELMRLELDRYVRYHAADYPLFAQRYQAIRRARRKPSAPDLPVDSDISGVVTNKETGEVIAGALITLIEHTYSIETDADGRYMLDELPPGTYTVSCHKPGFQVPEQASFILTNNDSVIHNFELHAVASSAA
jgi:hypothetical protein